MMNHKVRAKMYRDAVRRRRYRDAMLMCYYSGRRLDAIDLSGIKNAFSKFKKFMKDKGVRAVILAAITVIFALLAFKFKAKNVKNIDPSKRTAYANEMKAELLKTTAPAMNTIRSGKVTSGKFIYNKDPAAGKEFNKNVDRVEKAFNSIQDQLSRFAKGEDVVFDI